MLFASQSEGIKFMAEQYGRYVYDDSLRPGQAEDGGWSQLLFDDDGRLADHATFIPDHGNEDENGFTGPGTDEPSRDDTARIIAAAIGVAIGVVAATVTAPHIKRWWLGTIAPRLRKFRKRKPTRGVVTPLQLTAAPSDFSQAVDEALADPREGMSRAEAEQRLLGILAAAAFIADQLRALESARIESDLTELNRAMDKLTAQDVTDAINVMLARDSSLLDETTSEEFMRIFGGGREVNGQYLPIRNDRVRQALRLTQDETPEKGNGPRAFVPF